MLIKIFINEKSIFNILFPPTYTNHYNVIIEV